MDYLQAAISILGPLVGAAALLITGAYSRCGHAM